MLLRLIFTISALNLGLLLKLKAKCSGLHPVQMLCTCSGADELMRVEARAPVQPHRLDCFGRTVLSRK